MDQHKPPTTTPQPGHSHSDRAIETIRSNRHLFLFENLPQGAIYLAADGSIAECNTAAATLLGLDVEHIVGQPVVGDVFRCILRDGSSLALTDSPLIAAMLNGERAELAGVGVYNHKWDHYQWCSLSALPLSTPAGNELLVLIERISPAETERNHPRDFFGSFTDGEDNFSRLFHAIPLMMAVCSAKDGVFLDANDPFVRITGYRREKLLGATPLALGLVNGRDWEQILASFQQEGRFLRREMTLHRADGRPLHCQYIGEPIKVQGEVQLLSIVVDLSDLMHLEDELVRHSENLLTIFDTINGMMLIVDENGVVEMANHASCRVADGTDAVGRLQGEVLNCSRSFKEGGCGKTEQCSDCVLRQRLKDIVKRGSACRDVELEMPIVCGGRVSARRFRLSTGRFSSDGTTKALLLLSEIESSGGTRRSET